MDNDLEDVDALRFVFRARGDDDEAVVVEEEEAVVECVVRERRKTSSAVPTPYNSAISLEIPRLFVR